MPAVGVLALQGDVREHVATLRSIDVEAFEVKNLEALNRSDALVIPGGESTAIAHLLTTSGLRDPLNERLHAGMAVLGTCAGLILLAHRILDGRVDQWGFDVLDVDVQRNGYGRQIASFETELDVEGIGDVHGVFIRAPRIDRIGENIHVMASYDHGDGAHPVLVRQGAVWGCSFHPELTGDARVHEAFVRAI